MHIDRAQCRQCSTVSWAVTVTCNALAGWQGVYIGPNTICMLRSGVAQPPPRSANGAKAAVHNQQHVTHLRSTPDRASAPFVCHSSSQQQHFCQQSNLQAPRRSHKPAHTPASLCPGHGVRTRGQAPPTAARAVPDDSSQGAAETGSQQDAGPQSDMCLQQGQQSQQQGQAPAIAGQSQLGPQQQQQQPLGLQPAVAGQFRQQLKALLAQQQQLQQALDLTAGLQTARLDSSRGRVPRRSKLRTAAAGGTDLLLSLLQSQMPVLTGQVPVGSAGSSGAASPAVPRSLPDGTTQQQQQQQPERRRRGAAGTGTAAASHKQVPPRRPQQQWAQQLLQQQGRKQRCASGAPPHLPLLAEALNTIAWHCRRQQLLPSEASSLQGVMLGQLLPALAPHLQLVNKRQLARVVYALGSCYASSWEQQGQQQQQGLEEEEAQQQGEAGTGLVDQGMGGNASQPGQQGTASVSAAAAAARTTPNGLVSSGSGGSVFIADALPAPALDDAAAVSAGWVRRLLPLLPPSNLTAGALLAVWQGCALHEVVPPEPWLQAAAWAMARHLQGGKLDFNDTAGLLQACAALDYRPPGWLMVPLVAALQQQLGLLTPADLAGVLTSLQDLGFRPSDTWLRVWCEVSSRHLRGMSIDQLAAAAGALAWTSYSPKPWWGRRLTAAALPLLPVATADELLLLLHSLLSLRVAAAPGWVHEAYSHLARRQQTLGLSQLADAAHVLGSMGLPQELVQVHRSWLASCLQAVGGWQGGAAAAALSRSELLYMLYAAARLRASPGDTLLSASLTRLHWELPQASPAELAGCLSVFCFWWKQQQRGNAASTSGSSGVIGATTAQPSSSSSSRHRGAAGSGSELMLGRVPVVISLLQLCDCLSAIVSCSSQFSDEGLLQLLLTCAKTDWATPTQQQQAIGDPQQQQQQQQQQDGQLRGQIEACIQCLVDALLGRLPGMSLVQLARLSRTLDAGPSSSSSSGGGGSDEGASDGSSSSSRPQWYSELGKQVKAAMASRA